MSILDKAKAKATSGNVKGAFVNESGAIDLASIMVGIIVIGLIGGVIAATVFAVIPWAQDNAAKQQLDSVAAAQSAYIGQSADKGKVSFGDAGQLSTAKLFDATAAKVSIAKTGDGENAHYIAATSSSSGKTFYITDMKTQPTAGAGTVVFQAPAKGVKGYSATVTAAAAAGDAPTVTAVETPALP